MNPITKTTTLGRHPTLGEVLDYYTQESFLRFLLATTQRRRVVLVISKKRHWEPRWPQDEVRAEGIDELRAWIRNNVKRVLSDVAMDARPDFYPAFHQSVWKGDAALQGAASRQIHMDCVFEADLPTWRDAFHDVNGVIRLFERYGAPYQLKFSGHRSLHFVIPGDVLPRGYRAQAAGKLARTLLQWSSSQAHHLPKITRMPYSLNEDTGLVCLPLEHTDLLSFRPWRANLHLVNVPETAWDLWGTKSDRHNLAQLVDALASDEEKVELREIPRADQALAIGEPEAVLASHFNRLARLRQTDDEGALVAAVRLPDSATTIPESVLLEQLASEDADARWLAAEAYLLHGEAISRRGFETLLNEDEEYARVSASDVLLRFADDILPYTVEALRRLSTYSQTDARAAYLLTQSPTLRDAVFEALVTEQEGSHDARIIVACLTGALVGDWARAQKLIEPIEQAEGLATTERARLRKKLRALEMLSTLGGWNKREEAAKSRRLAKLGPEVTDLMLLAANSPERRFRRSVVAVLAELADPRAIELMIYALEDDYSQVRKRAIAGLIRIGEVAVDPLIEAASSDRLRTRRYAVHCLGRIGAGRAKATIIEALDDSQEVVRRQAVRALKELATTEDLPTLKQFLREALPNNAMEATEVLEALGEAGTEAMREMALEERVAGAAYFIARQGDGQGRKILAAQLEADAATRDDAVEFLRELRDERAVPYLIEQLRASTDWHGTFIAQELGAIGNEEAVRALIEALEREEHLIRRGAARGLDDARNPVAIDSLVRCLDDPDGKVRRLASDALAHLGSPARAAVREALAQVDEKDGRLRSILRSTLESLEEKI